MTRIEEIIEQVKEESKSTRKMLERITGSTLNWKPHDKSMSMGQLAWLVADMFGWFGMMLASDELDFSKGTGYPTDYAGIDLPAHLDKRLKDSLEAVAGLDDSILEDKWTMRNGEQIYLETQKGNVARESIAHLAHHRGQLSVYLRMNDIAVPSIYGPTADEQWG